MYNESERCVIMEIAAVGKGYDIKAAQLDAFANMDDNSVRQIAWLKTQQDIDFKKHKRVQTAFDVALPLAGGLSAAAVASKGKRLSAFAGGTANWALFLAGLGLTFGLTQAIRNRSEKADNFAEKHPVLTFLTTATAAYFAGRGAMIGGAIGFDKLKSTGVYKKAMVSAKKGLKKLGNVEFVKKATTFVADSVKKIPSPIKNITKAVAGWAPILTILGSFAHSVKFRNAVANDYNNTYNMIREKQLEISQMRNREFSFENDLHKTEA